MRPNCPNCPAADLATAFLAPLLIAIITEATGSQRLGVAVTAVFLVAGLLLMTRVGGRRAE